VDEDLESEGGAGDGLLGVLERVRNAVGHAALVRHRGLAVAEGDGVYNGVDVRFRLALRPAGSFALRREGAIGGEVGFDGQNAWEVDWSGMPRELHLRELEEARLLGAVLTHAWLSEGGPVAAHLDGGRDGAVRLRLSLVVGTLGADLEVDREDWLPRSLTYVSNGAPERWELSEYRPLGASRFPGLIRTTSRGVTNSLRVATLSHAPQPGSAEPVAPAGRPSDTTFDRTAPADLPLVETSTGHLLVRPLVNGRDVGWFIFDTGAGGTVISPAAADEAGLDGFGHAAVAGVGGSIVARFRRGGSLEVGPARIADPLFIELDLGFLSPIFGLEVSGVCGYDLLSRAVVEVEVGAPRISVYEPGTYETGTPRWQPLLLVDRHPCFEGRFEGGRPGLFRIDTGANRALTFNAPTVERYDLLGGRPSAPSRAGGVGGEVETRVGEIEWFEIAGHRFERPTVEFAVPGTGLFDDPYLTGNLGRVFLLPFRLVLDYPAARIALLPRGAATV
jgi:hypothetical protein